MCITFVIRPRRTMLVNIPLYVLLGLGKGEVIPVKFLRFKLREICKILHYMISPMFCFWETGLSQKCLAVKD